MDATLAKECSTKESKAAILAVFVRCWDFVCPRKDSRPEEKAKEPKGSAESERRRRECSGDEAAILKGTTRGFECRCRECEMVAMDKFYVVMIFRYVFQHDGTNYMPNSCASSEVFHFRLVEKM